MKKQIKPDSGSLGEAKASAPVVGIANPFSGRGRFMFFLRCLSVEDSMETTSHFLPDLEWVPDPDST